MAEPWVGIIANPVSARDIRRVIANAASLQITDRANIVLRVLACLKACGIQRVMMMPEAGGIRGHVKRGLDRSANQGEMEFPELSFVDMRVTGTVEDSRRAAAAMCAAGASAIVVLGGDGTHRAVASACGKVPLAGISTGTNNAFPEHREPTVTGLAVGLVVSLLLARYLKSAVFSVPATDPVSLIGVVLLLGMAAFFACWIPARRAARLDPMNALRHD